LLMGGTLSAHVGYSKCSRNAQHGPNQPFSAASTSSTLGPIHSSASASAAPLVWSERAEGGEPTPGAGVSQVPVPTWSAHAAGDADDPGELHISLALAASSAALPSSSSSALRRTAHAWHWAALATDRSPRHAPSRRPEASGREDSRLRRARSGRPFLPAALTGRRRGGAGWGGTQVRLTGSSAGRKWD
jgi:hypothetical protein